MIQIRNVTRRFGRSAAVRDVSLDLHAGDSLALWGANGAGKTTLIRCVLGLLRFEGQIRVGGCDVRRQGKAARLQIGYVPQELGFYDELGVSQAIGFLARLKGLGRVNAADTLARVGLDGHGRKRIRELSGGMKQRLALAIALLGDPPILVLDEVTASLDSVGRQEFVGMLERLSGAGRTMLFASHRTDEVAALAGRVAVMEAGSLREIVSREEFVSRAAGESALHLRIAPAARGLALASLRESGFVPHLNGVGVLVPVDRENKAAPFRILADARVTVDDFEIVSAQQARSIRAPEDHP